MSNLRGSILHSEAYALGKMLDHSSWRAEPCLPRLITPSDVDACFDNRGAVLLAEFSSSACEWAAIGKGQRILYENIIRGTEHCAVVCKHSVSANDERPIDTRYDIAAFQAMIHEGRFFVLTPSIRDNEAWQRFVSKWFTDPKALRQRVLQMYAEAAA